MMGVGGSADWERVGEKTLDRAAFVEHERRLSRLRTSTQIKTSIPSMLLSISLPSSSLPTSRPLACSLPKPLATLAIMSPSAVPASAGIGLYSTRKTISNRASCSLSDCFAQSGACRSEEAMLLGRGVRARVMNWRKRDSEKGGDVEEGREDAVGRLSRRGMISRATEK
jgi:hypothetical protein